MKNTKRYLAGILLFTSIFALGCTSGDYSTNLNAATTKNTNSTQAIVNSSDTDSVSVNANATSDNEQPTTNSNYAPNGTYQNVYGNTVPNPYYSDSVPVGASAKCRDGTYSSSQSRSGTCSHHGGVADWL